MKQQQLIANYLVGFLLILGITEVVFRLLGHQPFNPETTIEKITPSNPIIVDSLLGYSLVPGTYKFQYKNGYSFTATHNEFGERKISIEKEYNDFPKIAVYGDSNFYGFGLNNEQTWAYKLQQRNKSIHVINHSVFGYSLYLNYLKYKKNLEANESPLVSVFLIATYDLGRQAMSLAAKKSFVVNQKISNMYLYPYLEIDNGTLKVNKKPIASSFVNVVARHSGFFNFVEDRINLIYDKQLEYEKINNSVIDSIVVLSKKYKVTPVFALFNEDETTELIKKKLDQLNCKSVYINYDLSDKKYSLLPFDNHPNAYTNTLYCSKIESIINPIIKVNASTTNF